MRFTAEFGFLMEDIDLYPSWSKKDRLEICLGERDAEQPAFNLIKNNRELIDRIPQLYIVGELWWVLDEGIYQTTATEFAKSPDEFFDCHLKITDHMLPPVQKTFFKVVDKVIQAAGKQVHFPKPFVCSV